MTRSAADDAVVIGVPGDKSISHRALLLSALAQGESRLRGLLAGEDPRSTARVLRALGVAVPELEPYGSEIRIRGVGLRGMKAPPEPLYCGNSGTTARLLLGVLAGQAFRVVLDGDASLRSRPMRRVTEPLSAMGAELEELGEPDRLPLAIRGGRLRPIDYASPRASAQVKSALLLAGLTGAVDVRVTEPVLSRDHTERLLAAMGVPMETGRAGGTWSALRPVEHLDPLDLSVPGDPSSAIFFLALAALLPGRPLSVGQVCLNPTRTGALRVLERMGVDIEVHPGRQEGGEPTGDIIVSGARLRCAEIGGSEIPSLIDEIPILAVLAARAEGESRFTEASELRVKESDRIAVVAENLREIGVDVDELPDGLVVRGSRARLRGRIRTHGDHRIAMAFGVLACEPGNAIEIDDPSPAAVSYPGFWADLERVRLELSGHKTA